MNVQYQRIRLFIPLIKIIYSKGSTEFNLATGTQNNTKDTQSKI